MTEKEEKLEKKIAKDFPEFYDGLQGLGADALKDKLTTHAKHREETIKAKEELVPLNKAKDEVKDLSGPFNDTLKALNLRTKYIYLMMREKGGA